VPFSQAPDYVAKYHPFAKLPAFQDQKVKLFESRAISRYLAAMYPGALNPPSDVIKAAYYDQAASVEVSYFEPPIEKLGFELIFKK
jgi:glutathione S-transferase